MSQIYKSTLMSIVFIGSSFHYALADRFCCNVKPTLPLNGTNSFVEALRAKYCPPFFPVPSLESSCPSFTYVIGQENFDPAVGLIIDKPGVWCLKEDITWDPTADGLSAISINTSNVRLDLNNHSITQVASTTTNNVGINIQAGVSDVMIKNGQLVGIRTFNIIVNAGTSDIFIDGVIMRDSAQTGGFTAGPVLITGGIYLNGTTTNPINRVSIQNCVISRLTSSATSDIAIAGIRGFNVNDLNIIRVDITGLLSSNNTAVGVFLNGCIDTYFEQVFVRNQTGGWSSFGIASIATPGVVVNPNSTVLYQCEVVNNNQLNVGASVVPQDTHAFRVIGENVAFIECRAQNQNAVQSVSPTGIDCSGTNCLVENCVVTGINIGTTTSTFGVQGIRVLTGSNVLIRNCEVENVFANAAAAGRPFSIAGIRVARSPNSIMEECICQNIRGATGADVAGIFIQASPNSTVENCITNNNTGNGISLIRDPITPTLTPTINTLVQGCTATNNSGIGFEDRVGSGNAFVNNIAFRNGVNYSLGTSQSVNNLSLP